MKFKELRNGVWGISSTDYAALPKDGALTQASGLPQGAEFEVFDATTGKITQYGEVFDGHCYLR